MYIDKAVLKFNNSQPWQANQKKPNCVRRMYAPGSSTKSQHCSWWQKKASYNMLISFTPGWPSPFLGSFSRLRGENRTKKSLDMLCIFDLNQSRLSLGLFCLDFLLPTKLLNCFESCSNVPGMLISIRLVL
jgi:hypothetical protein